MMTVRFPNGQAIQYNTATFASRAASYTDLYEKKDGRWIAQVPNSCVIEYVPACRVYNPLQEKTLAAIPTELRHLARDVRALTRTRRS